jgi:hypothetical protein
MPELPDYERPPVVEVVAAVQFLPLPQFGMREAVAVSRAFDGWDVVDVPPALDPIVEYPAGNVASPALRFGLGQPPVRAILASEGERFLAQVQQDRIAAHERKVDQPPSFQNVKPALRDVATRVSEGLGRAVLEEPHGPEVVEVIYENRIPAGEGWNDFSEAHRVLRVFSQEAGAPPYERFEQARVELAYDLRDADDFAGRLRVVSDPQIGPDQERWLHLRLISRRMVHHRDVDSVLEQCHADIVRGFTAVTTERMHEIWGRLR